MANQAKNQKSKLLYLGVVLVAIIIAFFVFKIVGEKTYNLPSNDFNYGSSKTYTSSALKFSVDVPNGYTIQEDITFVELSASRGKISISKIATNYNNVHDYLNDFDSKRSIKIEAEEKTLIDNYESISRVENFNGGSIEKQKAYFIYVDNWVYSLSTFSPELFGDLDKIAGSFRYTP